MADRRFVPPRFGTDGLRGTAGQAPIDTRTLQRLGAALGLWLQHQGPEPKRVLIGDDGRESAGWIGPALAAGLAATDVRVLDVGLIPTPGLAFLVREQPVQAGIMISASHNPARDNGVKIFQSDGAKLPDAAETRISDMTGEVSLEPNPSVRVKHSRELARQYEEHLVNLFADVDLSRRKIVVDGANGACSLVTPTVLRGLGAEVVELACTPDGTNINAGAGALHPETMAQTVAAQGADFGVSLDGDGDRCIVCDETGTVRDGDGILTVLGTHLHRQGALPGDTLVATVMSNLGLGKALMRHGISLHQTPVGDRAVVAAMRDHGYALGGEQSGHIIFSGSGHLTGDGTYTALQLLSVLTSQERGLAAAFSEFVSFPQLLVNVPVRHKPDLADIDTIQAAIAEVETDLGDEGRVVLRYSGTEDLCRVMVEAPTEDDVQRQVERLVQVVRAELGA